MTIALSLATFMQVLDSTIANVAIPTIAGNLGSSLSQGTWVITSFGVANAISIPITGWLAKRFGEVRLFMWSTIAFVIASWACGMSTSLNMLIFFRVIQGIVAGPLIPLSQSLLLNNYPPAKRSIALALWSMTVIVAPICGPILGGYISDNYHWGWIFFINVPIGAAVVLMTCKPCAVGKPKPSSGALTPLVWHCWSSVSAVCRLCSTAAKSWTGSPRRRLSS
jgi:DHA2 family multidrug resistance protein